MPDMHMNPMAFDMRSHGATFGFDYRVSENFSFGAQLNMSSGANPYHPLFNRHYFGSGLPGGLHSPAPFHKYDRW